MEKYLYKTWRLMREITLIFKSKFRVLLINMWIINIYNLHENIGLDSDFEIISCLYTVKYSEILNSNNIGKFIRNVVSPVYQHGYIQPTTINDSNYSCWQVYYTIQQVTMLRIAGNIIRYESRASITQWIRSA